MMQWWPNMKNGVLTRGSNGGLTWRGGGITRGCLIKRCLTTGDCGDSCNIKINITLDYPYKNKSENKYYL